MKHKEISIKKLIPAAEAANILKGIVSGLEQGEIALSEEVDAIALKPRDMLSLEIKAKAKKDKEKIEIELSWKCTRQDQDGADNGTGQERRAEEAASEEP